MRVCTCRFWGRHTCVLRKIFTSNRMLRASQAFRPKEKARWSEENKWKRPCQKWVNFVRTSDFLAKRDILASLGKRKNSAKEASGNEKNRPELCKQVALLTATASSPYQPLIFNLLLLVETCRFFYAKNCSAFYLLPKTARGKETDIVPQQTCDGGAVCPCSNSLCRLLLSTGGFLLLFFRLRLSPVARLARHTIGLQLLVARCLLYNPVCQGHEFCRLRMPHKYQKTTIFRAGTYPTQPYRTQPEQHPTPNRTRQTKISFPYLDSCLPMIQVFSKSRREPFNSVSKRTGRECRPTKQPINQPYLPPNQNERFSTPRRLIRIM